MLLPGRASDVIPRDSLLSGLCFFLDLQKRLPFLTNKELPFSNGDAITPVPSLCPFPLSWFRWVEEYGTTGSSRLKIQGKISSEVVNNDSGMSLGC
ncbi:hypothetical protein LEMLEM_LOCUS247 [Lemmus lemmus]